MLTIVIAVVHLTLETAFTLKFGQTFTGYLPDLIAVTLLLVGGYLTIKNPNAVGICVVHGVLRVAFTIVLGRDAYRMPAKTSAPLRTKLLAYCGQCRRGKIR